MLLFPGLLPRARTLLLLLQADSHACAVLAPREVGPVAGRACGGDGGGSRAAVVMLVLLLGQKGLLLVEGRLTGGMTSDAQLG